MTIRRFYLAICTFALMTCSAIAQNIPQAIEYTEIYDFIEELQCDGIIQANTAVKPYTRNQIAAWLKEASEQSTRLDKRQRDDLAFYMQDYALELDTIPDYRLYGHKNVCQWTDRTTFNLSLVEPSFHFVSKKKQFKMNNKGQNQNPPQRFN